MAKTLVVASPMTGRLVTQSGAPAAGVTVSRKWSWGKRSGLDKVTTDSEGNFAFEAVVKKSFWASILPHEATIEQDFRAKSLDDSTQIMLLYKHNYTMNGELDGESMRVECVLGAEPGVDGFFFGTCKPIN